MKKLWIHAEPGVDKVADQFFHYPQVTPELTIDIISTKQNNVLSIQ